MNKFPVDLLAELCHMSPTHFRRNFQSAMHMAPLTYLNTIRIMNACNLLRNTNHTILTISEMTGFSTLSNFNRHFNQMMKVSPKEYRHQTLKGRKPGEIHLLSNMPAGWNPMRRLIPGNRKRHRKEYNKITCAARHAKKAPSWNSFHRGCLFYTRKAILLSYFNLIPAPEQLPLLRHLFSVRS